MLVGRRTNSGAYDKDGHLVEAEFERIFETFAAQKDRITKPELDAMITANVKRKPGPAASFASHAEFDLFFEISSEDGVSVSKDRVRRFYGCVLQRDARVSQGGCYGREEEKNEKDDWQEEDHESQEDHPQES